MTTKAQADVYAEYVERHPEDGFENWPKEIQDWLCREVLPSIVRTGRYRPGDDSWKKVPFPLFPEEAAV